MPAALAELLRPRRLARVRRTVARSRAEGALFDAVLWSVFALVLVIVLLCVSVVDVPILAAWRIDKGWLVAGGLLMALFVAGALWWRWFKWHIHAVDMTQRAPGPR